MKNIVSIQKIVTILALAALAGCSNTSSLSASGCTPEKGMMHGMNGKAYTGQCAGNDAAAMAWKKAYKRYEMKDLAIDHKGREAESE